MTADALAAWNTAANTLSNAASVAASGEMNRRTLRYNKWALQQQRDWAESDWHMLNEYNHPSAQMARLREAGLNPHLVYGKGADNTASAAVRGTEAKPWNPQAPDFSGIGSSLMSFYDTRMKQAQTDNLQVQNTVLEQDAILKAIQGANIIQQTSRSRQEQDQASELFPYSLEALRANIQKSYADTQFTLDQNERAAVMQSQNLVESMERVLNMRSQRANTDAERARIYQQVELLKRDNIVRQLDAELAAKGIRPNDAFFMRTVQELMDMISPRSTSPGKSLPERFKDKIKERLEWDVPWHQRKWRMW